MNLRKIYYSLSPSMRFLARKAYYLPIDLYETWTGKRHKYEPKKGDIYIGSGNFIAQGEHQVEFLVNYTGLLPSHHVLDIGSGIGRTAVGLTNFLDSTGAYDGFDVVEKGVKWCNSKINKDFANFNFVYVPLNNDLYNTSDQKASEFEFPYKNETFDRSFLFSVFTHMGVDEIEHYLSEISRTLKSGGKCLATFFLYNSEQEQKLEEIKNFPFSVKREGYRLMDEQVKSANIAIEEALLTKMLEGKGFESPEIIKGYWMDPRWQKPGIDFQDIVVLTKK